MKIILPNCRVQFTAADIQFISDTLGRTPGGRDCLIELLTDPDSRDAILDDPAILNALLETGGCLRVSAHFYFYVLVRRVLKRAGIDDRSVADYVAEVMAEFSITERSRCTVPGSDATLDYFFEMVAALQRADDRVGFYLRTHIGNQSLFMAGMFPGRIQHRAEQKGFPDLSYYQELGSMNFRVAGGHRLAKRYELNGILHTLAEGFGAARRALNDLADRLVTLGDPTVNLPVLRPDLGI